MGVLYCAGQWLAIDRSPYNHVGIQSQLGAKMVSRPLLGIAATGFDPVTIIMNLMPEAAAVVRDIVNWMETDRDKVCRPKQRGLTVRGV